MHARRIALSVVIVVTSMGARPATQDGAPPKLAAYKSEAAASIDGMYDLAQQMVDYDATKYKTYLDQLGITYPTTRAPAAGAQ